MLQLTDISKTYKTGSLVQTALDKVSLNLRDSEFVAILGPSGSGKTTLLNIIGGLDRYDSGDLIINGTSTKKYKDRDWDTYRNHAIGFVFQSYNLIPHQTVLSNVELALTIGGVSKKERRKRALDALAEVGLAEQAHKKPNQMSGGQMQRVAIARALVNNPDILLADEPTGALDTKTSVQVMELLREVANKRLVVMVTHNPELADTYSNRIVRLQDGKIIADTNPFDPSSEEAPAPFEAAEATDKAAAPEAAGILESIDISGDFLSRLDKITFDSMSALDTLAAESMSRLDKMAAEGLQRLDRMIGDLPEEEAPAEDADKASEAEKQGEGSEQAGQPEENQAEKTEEAEENQAEAVTSTKENPEAPAQKAKKKKTGKARMSYFTALSLSFNNLLTKKGRTILTSFAGSIGIIGIALILSLSQGFQNYIDKLQEDTLSSYPLTITSETANASDMILSMISGNDRAETAGTDKVTERMYMAKMFASVGTNDLRSFKKFLEDKDSNLPKGITKINYTYSIAPIIYTVDVTGALTRINPNSMMSMMTSGSTASLLTSMQSASGGGIFSEMTEDRDAIIENYDLLAGSWPQNYDEMLIVLSERNGISDLLVYCLGLRDFKELQSMITQIMEGKAIESTDEPLHMTYTDLLNLDLRLIHPTDTYQYNEKYDLYEDMTGDAEYMQNLYDNAERLKISGVVCAKKGNSTMVLSPGVAYTKDLTKHVIAKAEATEIVAKQKADRSVNVFSGTPFDQDKEDSKKSDMLDFQELITVDEDMIKDAFKLNIDKDALSQKKITSISTKYITKMMAAATTDTEPAKKDFTATIKKVCSAAIKAYAEQYQSSGTVSFSPANYTGFTDSFMKSDSYKKIVNTMLKNYGMSEAPKEMTDNLNTMFKGMIMSTLSACGSSFPAGTPAAAITASADTVAEGVSSSAPVQAIAGQIAPTLTEAKMKVAIATNASGMIQDILKPLTGMFNENMLTVDTEKFAQAFKFDMSEDQLQRIMSSMAGSRDVASATGNLTILGYQDLEEPTSISFYFKDFATKEAFLALLDEYNERVGEEKEINYTDITGILMSSVKKIVDSVTYVLIAFVSISLIVSSIMIAVITLISVMERTKEIGILRAMGASKHNISSIFNAETFIIGLLSGCIGIGVTLILIPPINALIHNLTDNQNISAVLPTEAALALILISVLLTIISGIIPSRKAAKQDPVIALRTE